ncbi:hypothetical protein TDB9533_00926 [Thalassocella blandensis]|nr:hypothetical protein TDB9533_00926 [Thalassocella blandensis]
MSIAITNTNPLYWYQAMRLILKISTSFLLLLCLGACTQHHAMRTAENPSNKFYGNKQELGEHMAHADAENYVYASNLQCETNTTNSAKKHYRVDKALPFNTFMNESGMPNHILNRETFLSPGDLIDIDIENGEGFSGRYVINQEGIISLPLIEPIQAAGKTASMVAEKLEMALVRAKIFLPTAARVTVNIAHWSAINVTVTGAVFQPGRVTINESRQESVIEQRVRAEGDFASKRSIVEAIRAASGVRPDAKIDQIILIRNGWQMELDLSGVVGGITGKDIHLVDGDQIVVPTTGCFQSALVKPSQITPRGMRVFMSNLTVPALDNAGAAVGKFSSSLPYGTTLLQAAVSANCVGGTQATNAPRKVVLASKNPLTDEFQVIERSVEQLMRYAQREDMNPYLMPNDALACYDSDVTNMRDVAKTVTDIIKPLSLLF